MKLRVIYQDDALIAVDKPVGISVHPGHGHKGEPTIVDLVAKQIDHPVYLVHRLDRDTSGVMLLAKTEEAKKHLQKQFERRSVHKTYLALVEGRLEHTAGIIDLPIARSAKNPLKRAVRSRGKASISEYRVLKHYQGYDLLEIKPKTGRTHQIRVHLSHIGHPIVGDRLYGHKNSQIARQWLHAQTLSFIDLAGKRQTITSPLAADLEQFLNGL